MFVYISYKHSIKKCLHIYVPNANCMYTNNTYRGKAFTS